MPQAAAAAVVKFVLAAGAGMKAAAVAGAITAAATKVALLVGINAVVGNQNRPRPQGGMINLTVNPDEPRRLQIGKRINGGVLTDWYVGGAKNGELFMVVYLGEGPMGRITKVFGGGRQVYSTPITHGVRTEIPEYRSVGDRIPGRLWVTYYDGRPGQTADSYLVGKSLGWTADHVGTGCAYVIIEAWWDSDNQTTPPSITFEVEGAKLYDRRKDTTAGGSGAHRANNPATWELSSNPAVALDHYLLGRYVGAVKTFGVGLEAEDVPYAPFAALANLCDEDVPRKVSGTLKRYEANGFLFADRTYADTIRDLCRAMNARPADFGGRIGIISGEEKTPVLTIADADVIDDVQESYTPKRSWADLVSVVRGTYQNPAQLYQAGEYPRVEDAGWTAADGGSPKEATLDLEMETDVERAQRLARLFALRERRQAKLAGTYGLRTIELEQGDWFIRAGGIFGAGKTFEVIDRVLDPRSMTVTLTAFEVDASDSAWDEDTAQDAPPAPIASTDELEPMEVPVLTVTGVTLSGTAAELPAIKVEWAEPDDIRVQQIVIEAVPEAGGAPTSAQVDWATGQVVFTSGITDDTDYLVRARFIGDFIPSAWTSNIAVTTLGDYSVGVASSVPWSGVTGAGRPDDNADVTGDNAAAAIVGQGTGATANSLAGLNATDNTNLTTSLSTSRRLIVSDFGADGRHWTTASGGTPEAVADPLAEGYADVANVGRVLRFNAFPRYVTPKGVLTPVAGRRYALIARVRTETAPSGGAITFAVTSVNGLTTAYAHGDPVAVLGTIPGISSSVAPAAGTWALVGRTFQLAASPNTFNAFWRPRLDITATGTGGRAEVVSFIILDVTDVPLGRLISGLLRDDGATAITEAAVITLLGTAAAITGQGPGATAAAADVLNDALRTGSLFNVNLPQRPAISADFTGSLGSGTPASIAALSAGTVVNVANEGDVRQFTDNTALAHRGWLPVVASQTYRLRCRARVTVNGTSNQLFGQFISYNAAGTVLGSHANTVLETDFVAADGWIERELTVTGATILAAQPTAAFVRAHLFGGRNSSAAYSGATWQAAWSRLEDATEAIRLTTVETGANVTETRTAAAITSQGNQATANAARGTTAARPAATGSFGWYSNTTTNTLQLDTAAGVWTDVAALTTVSPLTGLIANFANRAATASPPGTGATTPIVTVTPQGGSGSFTFAWEHASGDSAIAVTSPTSASTTFGNGSVPAAGRTATKRCVATDTETGLKAQCDVFVILLAI